MLKLFFLFLASAITNFAFAQTGLYKTFEDYRAERILKFDEIDFSGNTVIFKSGDEKVKYNTSEIWGFKYDGNLFRSDKEDFYRVDVYGRLVLYSYGRSSLAYLSKRKYTYSMSTPQVYMSEGLTGDIYTMPVSSYETKAPKKFSQQYESFQEKFPAHQKLYACADNTNSLRKFEKCAIDYNIEQLSPAQFNMGVIDLGDIDVLWPKVDDIVPIKAVYTFTNSGKRPVKIRKVTKPPHSSVSFTQEEVAHGEKGEVVIKFDIAEQTKASTSKNFTGRGKDVFSFNLNVFFEGISDPVTLRITGVADLHSK